MAKLFKDIPDDDRFNMGDWQPFLIDIFNIFAHNSKSNRDRDSVFISNKGFWGMANLVVLLGITSKPIEIKTLFLSRRVFFRLFLAFFIRGTKRNRDFIDHSKKGFVGMPNLVVILTLMSDSEWLTGIHL